MIAATCLAFVIYFEARNQPEPAQFAVAEVTIQRAIHVIAVEHDGFGFYHAIPEAIWHDPAGLQKALEGFYRDALAL